jgi:hypothetical protein
MKEALWKATKEPLRLLVLAFIPFCITYFGGYNAQWAVLATLILRYLDKYLHYYGQINKKEVYIKGITRF